MKKMIEKEVQNLVIKTNNENKISDLKMITKPVEEKKPIEEKVPIQNPYENYVKVFEKK
jgi:hypothetical protein